MKYRKAGQGVLLMPNTMTKQNVHYGKNTVVQTDEYGALFQIRRFVDVEELEQLEKRPVYESFKRLFDIISCLLCLIVLFIPMLCIAVWIKLDSKGPAIYKQERLGLNGKPFNMYKFRSMRLGAEADGPQWAKNTDTRVTRAGQFLRKTRLDELPQLINIIAGHMSVVGPRPEREVFYTLFDTYIHGFRQRLMIKPGLTGLAQINGGYDLLPEEKIVFDMEYMQRRSLALDILLILKTVRIVISHSGAR